MAKARLIVAIAGDSGGAYGVRALDALRRLGTVETCLIVAPEAARAAARETGLTPAEVGRMADIARGPTRPRAGALLGLLVAPCGPAALRAVAEGDREDPVGAAADDCLARGRRVVLLVTETPLGAGALASMAQAAERGAVIAPPVPAFYHRPASLDAVLAQTVGRALDLFGLEAGLVRRWTGRERRSP